MWLSALRSLSDDFEITALSTSRRESAQAASKVAVRSVIGPRMDWDRFCLAIAYFFCLSA